MHHRIISYGIVRTPVNSQDTAGSDFIIISADFIVKSVDFVT